MTGVGQGAVWASRQQATGERIGVVRPSMFSLVAQPVIIEFQWSNRCEISTLFRAVRQYSLAWSTLPTIGLRSAMVSLNAPVPAGGFTLVRFST